MPLFRIFPYMQCKACLTGHTAAFLQRFCRNTVHYGEDGFRQKALAFLRKREHCVKGLFSKNRAAQLVIRSRVRRIQAHGNSVHQAAEQAGGRKAVDQVAQAVGIDPDVTVRVFFFEVFAYREEEVDALKRLAVAAKHDRIIGGKLFFLKGMDNLIKIRLVFQPEVVSGSDSFGFLTDTEGAAAWASVGDVNIEVRSQFIQDRNKNPSLAFILSLIKATCAAFPLERCSRRPISCSKRAQIQTS